MKTNKLLQTIAIIAALCGLLSACGQKGPLYLPKHKQVDDYYLELPKEEELENAPQDEILDSFEQKDTNINVNQENGYTETNTYEQEKTNDETLLLP